MSISRNGRHGVARRQAPLRGVSCGSMRMQIDVSLAVKDEDRIADLGGERGKPVRLAEGLVVRRRRLVYHSGPWGLSASFIVEKGAGVPIDVVVGVLSAWIYNKLKGTKARVTIDRTEVEYDKKGRIIKVIRERLKKR
jgi:hypothetical protein